MPAEASIGAVADPVAIVQGLTQRYGKVTALDDVSLAIPAGTTVGLIGPDGVGKSTLMGLIAGARACQTGEITVLGGSMRNVSHRRAVCTRIAFMPQGLGRNLYPDLSVRENMEFFGRLFGQDARERGARIDRLLRATGLAPFPDRPAGKLSGGMKQKLGLCCALIHDPDLLILDEPTTGVDPLSRRQFWALIDAIRAERPGMSVLVSTAYMEEAEDFASLIAMYDGKVIATGTAAELRAQTGEADLEDAFVAILPQNHGHARTRFEIPPLGVQDGQTAIVAEGLTRRFGDFTAVDHVSFQIERGEIFGFLGSNGCGKTTTMKMLTGLLPASDGTASLFGHAIDAGDIDVRKRVGYMSQAFSLYTELTVQQNLELHARLFHLPAGRIDARIDVLVARFGLEPYRGMLADKLPLGVRQRLSLAVALIHEPEMLILDEPTSGVDPVARDRFWEHLIQLSREEEVTIFISTHFMNEAERCDRISLMHAGKVLACDTPAKLTVAKGAADLNDAFIAYLEEADDAAVDGDIQATEMRRSIEAVHAAAGPAPVFSLRRLLAYSYRETLEVVRDPVRLAFAFFGTAMLLLVFGFGITMDVEDLKYAAFDLDRTPESRTYLESFAGSRYFLERPEIASIDGLERRLQTNDIALALEIPPGFGRAIKRGEPVQVAAWIDGSNPFRAETILGYVHGLHTDYLVQAAQRGEISPPPSHHVALEPRYRYNPSFESIFAIVPRLPAILLVLFPAVLMAVSVTREKELGSITNLYVTPATRLEFLLGKQMPYVVVSFANFLILLVMSAIVFDLTLKGSVVALMIGALLYGVATTGLGLICSAFTRSQVAAVFATAIVTMMPTLQFSGLLQPVSTLEGSAKFIGQFWPTTYYMHVSVGAYTKGLDFMALYPFLLSLAAFFPMLTVISVLAMRRQEA